MEITNKSGLIIKLSDKSQKTLKKIGAFKIQKYIDNKTIAFSTTLRIMDNIEILSKNGSEIRSGQTEDGEAISGIGVKVFSVGQIHEGLFEGGIKFGRVIFNNGAYYIGEWENGVQHGKGKRVAANGDTQEGFWVKGVFQELAEKINWINYMYE